MEPTNILFLASPLAVDGPSSRTLALARGLALRGRRVHVFSVGGPLVPRFARIGVPVMVHRAVRPGPLGRLLLGPVVERARLFGPHVIHCQSPPLSKLAARLARLCRCVYVVSSNSRDETRLRIRRSRRFRGIIAPGEDVRGELVNTARVPKQYIRVIPDGIDLDEAVAPRRHEHVPVVGIIAPLRRHEGHEDFLHAARLLTDRGAEAQFVIAGTGPMLARLRRLAAELKIAPLLTFAWRFGDYRTVLSALDVLVVPSLRDGDARLVLKAIACRKPVVATGTGTLPGIIKDGETGMLVHKTSPGEIADAVGCLLANASLVERLTSEAARWARERFSLAQMVEHTLDVYDRAVNRDLP